MNTAFLKQLSASEALFLELLCCLMTFLRLKLFLKLYISALFSKQKNSDTDGSKASGLFNESKHSRRIYTCTLLCIKLI